MTKDHLTNLVHTPDDEFPGQFEWLRRSEGGEPALHQRQVVHPLLPRRRLAAPEHGRHAGHGGGPEAAKVAEDGVVQEAE